MELYSTINKIRRNESGRTTLRIHKTQNLQSWNKIGEMKTSLGKEFTLYESTDGKRVAQVDEDMLIHMIIVDGKPVYMNPKVADALKRVAEVRRYLEKASRRAKRRTLSHQEPVSGSRLSRIH